jgi:hypothetical protein
MGYQDEVRKYHNMMNSCFDCDNIGALKEYVGYKIERDEKKKCL